MLVQLVFTSALALILSALTVHFRDIRDILSNLLTLWFFSTPIIYWIKEAPGLGKRVLDFNPMTHLIVTYQEILFFDGPVGHWKWLLLHRRAVGAAVSGRLLAVRPAARFVCRGRMTTGDRARDVSKIYRRYGGRQFATLKSALLQRSILRDLQPSETFPALKNVSFTVAEGLDVRRHGPQRLRQEHRAQAGRRHHQADERHGARWTDAFQRSSSSAPGFHPEISGRENVFINGIMLGLSKREIQARFDEIVDFAELREFIDAPVKTYSSGMYMRLGFAVAINVDPDVLLVDEVLAVGDEGFTHKCLDKFGEFRRRGKTILLVTHSLNLIERFCDEAVWLDAGEKQAEGDPKRVIGAYLTAVEETEEQLLAATTARAVQEAAEPADCGTPEAPVSRQPIPPSNMFQATEGRWGSREVGDPAGRVPRQGPAAVVRVPHRRRHVDPTQRPRCHTRSTTSCSASACSTPTGCVATARTPTSKR